MSENEVKEKTMEVSVASEDAEAIAGVLIAFFAALMAISQMVNGELEEEMMIAHNKVVNYSNWYQSKSIKESLKKGELHYLETLIDADMVADDKKLIVQEKIEAVTTEIQKYTSEKMEILKGSSNIPEARWAQDLNGEMGKIIGADQWRELALNYDVATKKFDIGMLFFQISIVLGAICIIFYNNAKLQRGFIVLMIFFGIIGIGMSVYGYFLAP